MIVERTNKEVIVKLPASADTNDIQAMLNYLRYKELTAGFYIVQEEADKLAAEVNIVWKR
jgi:hypothetical protein